MRCTSCEARLDRYVEGTLSPREMHAVNTHLQGCARCNGLYTELHVVDALLATTRTPELPPNFTFAVMAEVRAVPQRAMRTTPLWAIVTGYLIATWSALAIGAWKFGLLGVLRTFAHPVTSAFTHTAHGIVGATAAVSPALPLVLVTVLLIFAIDIALIGGVIAFYRFVRPHVAARLTPLEVS